MGHSKRLWDKLLVKKYKAKAKQISGEQFAEEE